MEENTQEDCLLDFRLFGNMVFFSIANWSTVGGSNIVWLVLSEIAIKVVGNLNGTGTYGEACRKVLNNKRFGNNAYTIARGLAIGSSIANMYCLLSMGNLPLLKGHNTRTIGAAIVSSVLWDKCMLYMVCKGVALLPK